MKYPSDLDLLELFGVEPDINSDVTTFTVAGRNQISLSVSFNIADDSLQTMLLLNGRIVALVCQEGMTALQIDGDLLLGEFNLDGYVVKLKLKVSPDILVEWSGLRIR